MCQNLTGRVICGSCGFNGGRSVYPNTVLVPASLKEQARASLARIEAELDELDFPSPDYAALGYPEPAVGVSLDVESVREVAVATLDSMSRWLGSMAYGTLYPVE